MPGEQALYHRGSVFQLGPPYSRPGVGIDLCGVTGHRADRGAVKTAFPRGPWERERSSQQVVTIMQTQIEIPDNLVSELYKRAPRPSDRSLLVGKLLNEYFSSHPERQSDLDLINQNAEELNREAEDVLDYQVIP